MATRSVKLSPTHKARVKQLVKENYGTQKEFAKSINLAPDTINKFLNGKNVDRKTFESICKTLGLEDWIEICLEEDVLNPMLNSEHTEKFQDYIEEKLDRFAGRQHVFNSFEKFIKTNDRGYFTVLADPGEGKSTIAARYVKKNSCVYYFNSRRESWTTVPQFLRTICLQLIEYGDLGKKDTPLPPGATEDGSFLITLLKQVSRKLKENQQLVIVIDALDEVEQKDGGTLLCLPGKNLPEKVYFLLTSRRIERRIPSGVPKEDVDLKDREEDCKDDLREYFELWVEDEEKGEALRKQIDNSGLSQKDYRDELVDKSERNFLYMRYIIPEIIEGAYKDFKIEKLPEGLTGYYEDHLDRMIIRLKQQNLTLDYLQIVYVICEYRGISIPFEEIVDSTDEKKLSQVNIHWLLEFWWQFLHENQRLQGKYKFYHESYTDFLRKDKTVKICSLDLPNFKRKSTYDLLNKVRRKKK